MLWPFVSGLALGPSRRADGAWMTGYFAANSSFTMAPALPKSMLPAWRSFSAAMTLPMSLSEDARRSRQSLLHGGARFLGRELARHEFADDGDFVALAGRQFRAAALVIGRRRILALLDHLGEHAKNFLVRQVLVPHRNALLLDLGHHQADGAEAFGLSRLHGGLHRLGKAFA